MTDLDVRRLHIVPPDPPRHTVTKWMVVWAALIAVTIATLLWLVVGGPSRHNGTSSAPISAPAKTSPVAVRPVSALPACHLRAGSQQVPKAAPRGVSWADYQGVVLPYSRTAGPEFVTGDIARCWSDSPVGALLADVQLGTRYLVASHWRTIVADQVVPGPGVAAYEKIRPAANDVNPPGTFAQIAGFAVLNYTPKVAVIELVSRGSDGVLQVVTTSVQWSGTDWRLVLVPAGGTATTATQIDSLLGFTPWGGV